MKLIFKFFTLFFLYTFSANAEEHFSHELWNQILNKHVSAQGNVNYKGIKTESEKLERYLTALSAITPDEKSWSKEEQLAFWINAYNAFTVKLILDNYPLKSIKDLPSPWDKKFFKIGDKKTSLNYIEHQILRNKFNEPRIHFAIVCGSYSCPKLLNTAYTANDLSNQLARQTSSFLNDKTRNKIATNSAQISEIFSWFKEDFTKTGTLIDFINQYSSIKLDAKAKISYLPYNWNLNE